MVFRERNFVLAYEDRHFGCKRRRLHLDETLATIAIEGQNVIPAAIAANGSDMFDQSVNSIGDWCAWRDSNPRPMASEATTLSG